MRRFQLCVVGLLLFATTALQGQTSLGNGFMEGTYMEVGIGTCGAFTASVDPQLPDSGHLNIPAGNLSIVADVGADGWNTGLPNPYCGDYFLPGFSIEAFSLEIDSAITTSGTQILQCGFDEFGGENVFNWRTPNQSLNIWRSIGPEIAIRQVTVFLRDRRYIVNNVDICNMSDNSFNEVYYMRTMDPDPSWAWNSSFVTKNEVLSQPYSGPEATVVSRAPITAGGFSSECTFGMLSVDDNARASYGGFFLGRPSDAWNQNPPYQHSGSNIADESVQMSWYWPQISVGECVCFSYAFLFDSTEYYPARLTSRKTCESLPPFVPTAASLTEGELEFGLREIFEKGAVDADQGKLNFAPNPGDAHCRFFNAQLTDAPATCSVFDPTGKLLLIKSYEAKPASIQLAGLAPGMYLIELRQNDLRLSGRYVLR